MRRDFWQEKRTKYLEHLLTQNQTLRSQKDSTLDSPVDQAGDISKTATSVSMPQDTLVSDPAPDWTASSSLDIAGQALPRTDSSVSLYDDLVGATGMLAGAVDPLDDAGDHSHWFCDYTLPDSPDSWPGKAVGGDTEVLRNTFLPAVMDTDDALLKEAVSGNALDQYGRDSALTYMEKLLDCGAGECIVGYGDYDDDSSSSSGSSSSVSSDGSSSSSSSDSDSTDTESDNDDGDGTHYSCSSDEEASDAKSSAPCSEAEAEPQVRNVKEEPGTAEQSLGCKSSVKASTLASMLTGLTPPRTLAATRSAGQATCQETTAFEDQRPVGVFSPQAFPSLPTGQLYAYQWLPSVNMPHPGSILANQPAHKPIVPPQFFHSIAPHIVAHEASAAMAATQIMLQQSHYPVQMVAPGANRADGNRADDYNRDVQSDSEYNDSGSDDDEQAESEGDAGSGDDGDGEGAGDSDATTAKKVVVRRITVDRSNKHKIPSPLQLWEFVLHLLELAKLTQCIDWIDPDRGSFRITDSAALGKRWGAYRRKPKMNYDKMSRAMRYYYRRKIFVKIDGRLVYQFSDPVMKQVRAFRKKATHRRRG